MSETVSVSPETKIKKDPRRGLWLRLIPFFLSASLFLSGFFAVFAPLPLVTLGLTQGFLWVFAASIVNAVIVYFARGPELFQFYLFGVVSLGLLMPYFLRYRKWSLERTTAGIWIAQILAIVLVFAFYAHLHGVSPLQEMKSVATGYFDAFMKTLTPEARTTVLGELSLEEWTRQMMIELPSTFATLALTGIWINLYLAVSLNPGRVLSQRGMDRKAFQRWKTADWLVWPTIAIWAVMLLTEGTVSDAALGVFKVLMTVYAIQGLAILGAVFDAWRIVGFFRLFILMMILFVMLPLLLGIGFFDQWFDFRSKIRQSS